MGSIAFEKVTPNIIYDALPPVTLADTDSDFEEELNGNNNNFCRWLVRPSTILGITLSSLMIKNIFSPNINLDRGYVEMSIISLTTVNIVKKFLHK